MRATLGFGVLTLTYLIQVLYAAILVPFFLATTFSSGALQASKNTSFYLLAVLKAAQVFGRLLPKWYADQQRSLSFAPEALLLFTEALAGICGFPWLGVESVGGVMRLITRFWLPFRCGFDTACRGAAAY